MGAWQEIADYTVPSNTTSVVLDSFGTITKDDFVKIVVTLDGDDFYIDFNTATPVLDNSDYHTQRLIGYGNLIYVDRVNVNNFGQGDEGDPTTIISYLKLSENDRVNVFNNGNLKNDSEIRVNVYYLTSSGVTFPSGITSIGITTKSTSVIASGSRIQIYKLAAEKVADITVESNTTQVDISNLSIDKDSEYLLVSDIDKTEAAQSGYNLTPNDLTTITDYYNQTILGNGSTASANRRNDSRIGFVSTNNFYSLSYSHIKLSNIGAFTHQTYNMCEGGSSSVFLINNFSSSTSEAITSITKLNIVATVTNAIAAGSRFILYKLY